VLGEEALDIVAPWRPHGSQMMVSVGARTSARVMASRGMPDKSLHISTANQTKFAKAVHHETSTNKKPGEQAPNHRTKVRQKLCHIRLSARALG
jgi:hypothetical protein